MHKGEELASYGQELVSDLQLPVLVCRPALDDLGDVDTVVSWDMLIPYSSSDAEP